MSRFKSWEGKAVDSNLPWHMSGQSLACAAAVSLCSVALLRTVDATLAPPPPPSLGSLAQRPLPGGARNMPPKTYLTFGIYPALSRALQPPPHIEPASTHQHDGLNGL